MRLNCKRARLAEIAGLVSQAVSAKSTKKIFECIRLTADSDGLELAGTDLEVAVRYRFAEDVEVKEQGQAVVPAQLFSGILREIADEQVTIVVAKQKLKLDTDGGVFELECEDASQYPEIPAFPKAAGGRVATEDLRALVRKTVFSAGKEAARFVLNGVRIDCSGDRLRFVATDGRRLAMLDRAIEAGEGSGESFGAIVGVKGLQHFERIAAGAEGSVEIALGDRFVALRTQQAEVTARVMDGNFPEVSQIIPEQTTGSAQIPVSMLAARLRQVGQFASVESQAVVLSFAPGGLGISAAGSDGRADVKIGIDYSGGEERIGFNPAYLLEALKVADGEQITFAFSNRNAAAKITDESGLLYVIMPVLID
jgi:DNA polymerase-3 subunit beta